MIVIGLAARQRRTSTHFASATAIGHEPVEANDEKRRLRLQKALAGHELPVIDKRGFGLLSKIAAALLFELISQHCERGVIIVTPNPPLDEWTGNNIRAARIRILNITTGS